MKKFIGLSIVVALICSGCAGRRVGLVDVAVGVAIAPVVVAHTILFGDPPPRETAVHEEIIVTAPTSPTFYYSNPPVNPGYGWRYWYILPDQPGFVFFLSNDGRRYRHHYNHHGPTPFEVAFGRGALKNHNRGGGNIYKHNNGNSHHRR